MGFSRSLTPLAEAKSAISPVAGAGAVLDAVHRPRAWRMPGPLSLVAPLIPLEPHPKASTSVPKAVMVERRLFMCLSLVWDTFRYLCVDGSAMTAPQLVVEEQLQ